MILIDYFVYIVLWAFWGYRWRLTRLDLHISDYPYYFLFFFMVLIYITTILLEKKSPRYSFGFL